VAAAESIISTRVATAFRQVPVVAATCVAPTDAAAHEFSHTLRGVFTFPGFSYIAVVHTRVRGRAIARERDLLVSTSAREHMSRVVWLVPMKS